MHESGNQTQGRSVDPRRRLAAAEAAARRRARSAAESAHPVAALFDVLQLERQEPRHLRQVLRFGERMDEWIDVWSGARDEQSPARENVDALLARVEQVVRDPPERCPPCARAEALGEREIARARRRATRQIATPATPDAEQKAAGRGEGF